MRQMGLPTGFNTSRPDLEEEEYEEEDTPEVSIQEILNGEPAQKKRKQSKPKRRNRSEVIVAHAAMPRGGAHNDSPAYCLFCKIQVSDMNWHQHALGKRHMNKLKCDIIVKTDENAPYVWCLCCGMLVPPNSWEAHGASKKHQKQNLAGGMFAPPDETAGIMTEFSDRGDGVRHCNLCTIDAIEDHWVDHILTKRHKQMNELWRKGCKVSSFGTWTTKFLKEQARKKKAKARAKSGGRGRGRGGIGFKFGSHYSSGYSSWNMAGGRQGYGAAGGSGGYHYGGGSGSSGYTSKRKFGDGFKKKKKTKTPAKVNVASY